MLSAVAIKSTPPVAILAQVFFVGVMVNNHVCSACRRWLPRNAWSDHALRGNHLRQALLICRECTAKGHTSRDETCRPCEYRRVLVGTSGCWWVLSCRVRSSRVAAVVMSAQGMACHEFQLNGLVGCMRFMQSVQKTK